MSELFPTKTIAIEVVGCAEDSRMWEFNYWLDKVLIPELRKTPGIVDVYRYRDMLLDFGEFNIMWGPPQDAPVRYLNLYRINSSDPWVLMQRVKDDNKKRAEKEGMEFIHFYELTVWDFIFYRRTTQPLIRPETHLPDGMPEAFLLVTNSSVPGKEFNHDDWWLYTHAHDLMEIPGYVQCSRFRNLDPNPPEDQARTCNIYEIDTEDVRAACLKNFIDDRSIRAPQGRFSGFVKRGPNTYAHGVYQHWDPM